MYGNKTNYKHKGNSPLSYLFRNTSSRRKKKKCGSFRCRGAALLLAEGLAVGALIHGRVLLMGADQDPVQRAVVFGVTVIGTGLDSTFDALVGMVVHRISLLFAVFVHSMNGSLIFIQNQKTRLKTLEKYAMLEKKKSRRN